ncbi:MAG TPA: YraN family protein [Bacteroidales bacterium]|nr:YraN family protein [Bacteroidales bacterium]
MAESHELGQKGEERAADLLKKKGYRILFRNWKWGNHEIDIIAENRDFVVFVEVKTRSAGFMEDPVKAVPVAKQKSIIKAAEGYIQRFRIDKESRFDIVTIINKNEELEIDHIEDAFYPTLR